MLDGIHFTTSIESFCDNIADLKILFDAHYLEISQHYHKGIPLSPNYDKYKLLEDHGELLFVALRSNGKLVGYFSGFLGRALHYDVLSLALDLIYVAPEYRGKVDGVTGGTLLMSAVKAEAQRRGVKVWTMGYKTYRAKHMQKLLSDFGFQSFEAHAIYWFET